MKYHGDDNSSANPNALKANKSPTMKKSAVKRPNYGKSTEGIVVFVYLRTPYCNSLAEGVLVTYRQKARDNVIIL